MLAPSVNGIVPPEPECDVYMTAIVPPPAEFFLPAPTAPSKPTCLPPLYRAPKPHVPKHVGAPRRLEPEVCSAKVQAESFERHVKASVVGVEEESTRHVHGRGKVTRQRSGAMSDSPTFVLGDSVEYFSRSVKKWLPTTITKYDAAHKLYDTGVRRRVPEALLRKPRGDSSN